LISFIGAEFIFMGQHRPRSFPNSTDTSLLDHAGSRDRSAVGFDGAIKSVKIEIWSLDRIALGCRVTP
jgi:hypothetical protein